MHLLYRSNDFWKAPWKFSCVSVSMTFITASFISSIVSYRDDEELCWCLSWSNSLWQGWSCGQVHCHGGNVTDPIWRVLASSDGISSWTPLKHQHSNPNPNPLTHQLWYIDSLTPQNLSSSLIDSLPSLNLLCHSKTDAQLMQDGRNHPEAFHAFMWYFSKFKTQFYCISFF